MRVKENAIILIDVHLMSYQRYIVVISDSLRTSVKVRGLNGIIRYACGMVCNYGVTNAQMILKIDPQAQLLPSTQIFRQHASQKEG